MNNDIATIKEIEYQYIAKLVKQHLKEYQDYISECEMGYSKSDWINVERRILYSILTEPTNKISLHDRAAIRNTYKKLHAFTE